MEQITEENIKNDIKIRLHIFNLLVIEVLFAI